MSIPRLLQIMREEGAVFNEQLFFIGEVTSISPLRIKTNDIILDSDQLKIHNYLVDVDFLTQQKYWLKDRLNNGDNVLLLKVGSYFTIVGKQEGVS